MLRNGAKVIVGFVGGGISVLRRASGFMMEKAIVNVSLTKVNVCARRSRKVR